MRMSHFICQTLWNTSFQVVFQTIISYGWQAMESQWHYREDSDGGGNYRTNVYTACSDGVVIVALRDLVVWEFSVRRPRGGRSVILLSSYEVN